jgi:hypothetical protein
MVGRVEFNHIQPTVGISGKRLRAVRVRFESAGKDAALEAGGRDGAVGLWMTQKYHPLLASSRDVHSRVRFHESPRWGYAERVEMARKARGDEPSDCISCPQCCGGRKRLEKVRFDEPSLGMRHGGGCETDEACDEPPSLGTNGDRPRAHRGWNQHASVHANQRLVEVCEERVWKRQKARGDEPSEP